MKNKLKNLNLESWVNFLLASLSGILLALSFPKSNLSFLIFFSLIPIFWIFSKVKIEILKIFSLSLIFGLSFYLILLYWIVYTLVKYGNLILPLAIFLLFLLSTYLSLYFFIFFGIALFFKILESPSFLKGLYGGILWVGVEFLRSLLLTGFPWGLLGYPLTYYPLFLQSADLGGIWLLSFLAFFFNYFCFFILKNWTKLNFKNPIFIRETLFFGLFIIVFVFYGKHSWEKWEKIIQKERETSRIALLQGNIPQELKEAKEIKVSLRVYQNLTLRALKKNPPLIFYPETALPFYFLYDRYYSLEFIKFLLNLEKTFPDLNIVFGAFRVDNRTPEIKVYNTLFVWKGKNLEDFYDKEKLVPFGEYIPLLKYFPFLKKISVVSDLLKPGKSKNLKISLAKQSLLILPLICFESAFPQILVKRLRAGGELIFIATNDAWFGKTSAPYQHFQMAIVRAVEGRRFTLQAANTGITGIIDPLGRVLKKSALEEEDIIVGEIKPLKEKSLFVRGGFLFPYFSLILLFFSLLIILWKRSPKFRKSCR